MEKHTQKYLDIDMIQKVVVYECGIHEVDDHVLESINENLYVQDGMLREKRHAYPNNGKECPECLSEWLHDVGL